MENDKKLKQKGKNPGVLHLPGSNDKPVLKESSETSDATMGWKIVGDTKDKDPFVDQECIATRLQFLNYCQKNNYQFAELRRAKHTTMMILANLHKPRAEPDQQIKAHLQVIAHATSCRGPPGCLSSNC